MAPRDISHVGYDDMDELLVRTPFSFKEAALVGTDNIVFGERCLVVSLIGTA